MSSTIHIRYTPHIETGTCFALERLFIQRQAPVYWDGEAVRIDLRALRVGPLTCGAPLAEPIALLIDQSSRWHSFSRYASHSAQRREIKELNSSLTFGNLDKHHTYDVMAGLVGAGDRLPTTVLLPDYIPASEEERKHYTWVSQRVLAVHNTRFGWDETRRETDWKRVEAQTREARRGHYRKSQLHQNFYPKHDMLGDVIERSFGNRFPVYLKPASGSSGVGVVRCTDLDALRAAYRLTQGTACHVQEAVEDYDLFIRCIAVGPQVLLTEYRPDAPHHAHYSPAVPSIDPVLRSRIERYVLTINAMHHWTFNSFECLIKGGRIYPIDFANANPDTAITSLHVHFAWVLGALARWVSFMALADIRFDLVQRQRYFALLNDQSLSVEEKFAYYDAANEVFYRTAEFKAFCATNFADFKSQLIVLIRDQWDAIVEHTLMSTAQFSPEQIAVVRADLSRLREEFLSNPDMYLDGF